MARFVNIGPLELLRHARREWSGKWLRLQPHPSAEPSAEAEATFPAIIQMGPLISADLR